MNENRIENLVICSTLNQITNYLMIKKYNPKKIYTITLKNNNQSNVNINTEKWDRRLEDVVKKKFNKKIEKIYITQNDIYKIQKIKNKIDIRFKNIDKSETTYWHITGGQRLISIAMSEYIKDRENDKLLYVEGNSEKIIQLKFNGENATDVFGSEYGDIDLNFNTALALVGFHQSKEQKNSFESIEEEEKYFRKEQQFYLDIYKIIGNDENNNKLEIKIILDERTRKREQNFYIDTPRNLLLKSNTITDEAERKMFLKELFLNIYHKKIAIEDLEKFIELKKAKPAGYIFEKLVSYQINQLISKNNHIVDMQTSLKAYYNRNENNISRKQVDEIDIILLTDTGKIINFECKSGEMSGDNAKSTNYTTYRLAGVFGMPVLVSPLYKNEIAKNVTPQGVSLEKNSNIYLEHQFSAFRSAERAELTVIHIDDIKNGLRKLGIETNE